LEHVPQAAPSTVADIISFLSEEKVNHLSQDFCASKLSCEKSSWHASCIIIMKSTFWWNALKSYPAGEPCLNPLIALKTNSSPPLKKKEEQTLANDSWMITNDRS